LNIVDPARDPSLHFSGQSGIKSTSSLRRRIPPRPTSSHLSFPLSFFPAICACIQGRSLAASCWTCSRNCFSAAFCFTWVFSIIYDLLRALLGTSLKHAVPPGASAFMRGGPTVRCTLHSQTHEPIAHLLTIMPIRVMELLSLFETIFQSFFFFFPPIPMQDCRLPFSRFFDLPIQAARVVFFCF